MMFGKFLYPAQIFRQVSDKSLSQEIITPANALFDATIIGTHFLNYVVSCPGTRPFLFHSAFKDTF
jgi:hypothetical protein